MMNDRSFNSKINRKFLRAAGNVLSFIMLGMLVWCISVVPSPCNGEEKTTQEGSLPLSLKKCIELMFTNNLDLKVERHNPYLTEKEITKEKAAFDPFARFSFKDNKMVISPTTLLNGILDQNQSYEQETIDYEFSLAKKLLTGGVAELKYTTNKYETNSIFQFVNPTYFSNVLFSLNQPLLRNFGINLNKAGIIISSNNRDISQSRLKDKTMTMLVNLQQIYWNLYLSEQVLDVNRNSLRLAKNLMERNEALVEVGKLPSVEVLRAKTGVASREENVILAENSTKDAEDLLKETLNLPLRGREISLLDTPAFQQLSPMAAEECLTIALENRPDYEEVKIQLKNLKVHNKVAKNAMLPAFDFQASYGINATKGHYDESVQGLDKGGDYSWLVGFKVEIPLGNRWAKSNYQQSLLELSKAETAIKSLEQKIELEIREALREVESSYKRVSATEEALELAKKNLEAEEERMDLGMSTSVDVLRVQEELAAAQSKATKAIVDHIISLNNLDKALGTILEKNQISVQGS